MMRVRGNGLELPRLIWLLVTTSLGWVVIGTGLLVGGLIWGLNSHQVSYQSYSQSSNYHISRGTVSGNVYINENGSSDYFAAFMTDFTPIINPSDVDQTAAVSFVARTDASTLDPALSVGDTTINKAYRTEKLVLYDRSGNIIRTYTTAGYDANPNGYNANNWLYAGILMLLGILAAGNSIFLMVLTKKRKQQAAAAERARLETIPSPFARELGGTPSMQPYREVEQ